jgi:hypothetical protein
MGAASRPGAGVAQALSMLFLSPATARRAPKMQRIDPMAPGWRAPAVARLSRNLARVAAHMLRVSIVIAVAHSALLAADPALPVGTIRQLFLDEHLLDRKHNVELVLHAPTPREIVIRSEHPWEGPNQTYVTVFQDDKKFRLYYRSSPPPAPAGHSNATYTAMAESEDGVRWTKPRLGIVDFGGSKENNLVWPTDANKPWRDKNYPGTDLFPFKDRNPAAPASQRYKALANVGEYELAALVSPDGIHWQPLRIEPVISHPEPDPMLDPPSVAYWDERQRRYVAYLRCWINYRIRGFRRLVSEDFIHWSEPEVVGYGDAEIEHLYTSMATPYDRAPGLTLMFAKRFVPDRKRDPAWPRPGLSEIVLLSSRDGVRFDRTFMEPFLAPGLDRHNWHDRAVMMGRGILQTAPTELSLYYVEHYHLDSVRIRRATLRPDGFASAHAPWAGGEFTTKPLRFEGSELELNFATSVAGSVRVEIQDERGKPIPGYRLEDAEEIFGDELDRVVTWRKGHSAVLTPDRQEIPYRPSDIARALGGKTIRLRFVMQAAHLYSFRFK